jgi:hypothetical protein
VGPSELNSPPLGLRMDLKMCLSGTEKVEEGRFYGK